MEALGHAVVSEKNQDCLDREKIPVLDLDLETLIERTHKTVIKTGKDFGLDETKTKENFFALISMLKHEINEAVNDMGIRYVGTDKIDKSFKFENKYVKISTDMHNIISITVKKVK